MDNTTATQDKPVSAAGSSLVNEADGSASCVLRAAVIADLEAINHCIADAIETWDLPARVKRLSLPLYRYHESDLDHLQLVVAESVSAGIVGVAAWETDLPRDATPGRSALLLHGIYVAASHQCRGLGSQLLRSVESAAQTLGRDGTLVRAQTGATTFFASHGYQKLTVINPDRDYPYRYWKALAAT